MRKMIICLIGSLALFFTIQSIDVYGQSQSFPLKKFKNLVKQRIKWTGARDTISARVPKAESCVEAATDRAIEITYVIKSMQARGQFGNYGAKVGTKSGWNPGIGSMHTYTVVEIVDVNGKTVHILDVDNYMGPIYISTHSPINWNSNYVNLVQDISSWNPTSYIAKTKKLIKAKAKKKTRAAIAGTWSWECCERKYYGTFTLTQQGENVKGSFSDVVAKIGGNINGTIKGKSLRFTRVWSQGSQVFRLTLSDDGKKLEGIIAGSHDPSVGTKITATRK